MEPDKNIIDVTIYEIKNKEKNEEGVQLHAYTALWCGPCKRIKPNLIEIMSKHGYKVIEQKTMQKADFKKEVNEFVPFFVVMKSGELLDSIQTSDEMLFTQFLSRNEIGQIILDDDF